MAPDPRPPIYRNQLLNALEPDDLALFEPELEALSLPSREVLERAHTPIDAVYFIEQGIASVVALSRRGRRIEVGIVGREGMTGMTVVMGRPNEEKIGAMAAGCRVANLPFATRRCAE